MFSTFKTLITGANARAEERLRETYSIELIEQKIREAQSNLKGAKQALATLIQRSRGEQRQIASLESRVSDLMGRADDALQNGREDLAQEAAQAIAEMENELTLRRETMDRLDSRVIRLRASVESAHRRIIDLKQGAISAKAVRREQDVQMSMRPRFHEGNAMDEADELIKQVLGRDDPFEQSEILREIDTGLNNEGIANRLAEAGFGQASKTTAADVLKRLQSK